MDSVLFADHVITIGNKTTNSAKSRAIISYKIQLTGKTQPEKENIILRKIVYMTKKIKAW